MTKKDFDINVFLSNIEFFCEKSGKKIGELERETGVSTGYFSRIRGSLTNDKPKIPKMHVALAVAKNLHIPLDVLATVKFSSVEEERQMKNMQYTAELINRTNEQKISWERIPLNINALRKSPMFATQQIVEAIYPAVASRNRNVVVWTFPNVPEKVLVLTGDIWYMRRNDSIIYFTEGIYVPPGYVSINFPTSPEDRFFGLWLHTESENNFSLMNAINRGDEINLYTMFSSLKDSINAAGIQAPPVAQEITDEIDSLLKESAFKWGV